MFPLRVHAGYEVQYKRLQINGFVGIMSKSYQGLVFEVLQKIKPEYNGELNYLKNFASPKIQFGGELKLDIGKGISIGATAQTFNATITDTPRGITTGILPENLIYSLIFNIRPRIFKYKFSSSNFYRYNVSSASSCRI